MLLEIQLSNKKRAREGRVRANVRAVRDRKCCWLVSQLHHVEVGESCTQIVTTLSGAKRGGSLPLRCDSASNIQVSTECASARAYTSVLSTALRTCHMVSIQLSAQCKNLAGQGRTHGP
jgi:hypothetical protein